MDDKLQAALQGILVKPLGNLSTQDKAFLRARREYLTSEQRNTYKDILGEQPPASAEPTQAQETLAGEKNNDLSTEETITHARDKVLDPMLEQAQAEANKPEPFLQDPAPEKPFEQDPVNTASTEPTTGDTASTAETNTANDTGESVTEKNPYEDDGSSDPDSK